MSHFSFLIGLFLSILSFFIYLMPGIDLFWEVFIFIGRAFPIIALAGILFAILHIIGRAKNNRAHIKFLLPSLIGIALCAINIGTYYFIWNFN